MSNPGADRLKIVAPINSPDDVELFQSSGASELYCGLLPKMWSDRFGFSDTLNKRQGTVANLQYFEQLAAIQAKAANLNIPVSLTLNTSYSEIMLPMVFEIAEAWAEVGGHSIMVSDLSLLLLLQKKIPKVRPHLSILANSFNSRVPQFFKQFGVTRIVLPRELGFKEMKQIIDKSDGMEFEVMALNDKCRFIDGHCHFYHSTVYDSNQRFSASYSIIEGKAQVRAYDPCYSGHGCSIIFGGMNTLTNGKEKFTPGNPGCAACFTGELLELGISYLKLGGRGLPAQMNAQNIRFIKKVCDVSIENPLTHKKVREIYQDTFGNPCNPTTCYYAEWIERK